MKKKSEEVFFNEETYFGEQKKKEFSRMQECTPSLVFDTFQFLIKNIRYKEKQKSRKRTRKTNYYE
jgi:hypothetical protein